MLRLAYHRPLAWTELLSFLAVRATPGVERVADGCYARTISLGGQHGTIAVRRLPGESALGLLIDFPDPARRDEIVSRVRALFDLDARPRKIAKVLGADARLQPRLQRAPGARVPGAWDGFELAVRAVLGQQVTVRAATTLAGRLARKLGQRIPGAEGDLHLLAPRPGALASADLSDLGIPRSRARALNALASAVLNGAVSFDRGQDPQLFREALKKIPGVGAWTAEYVVLRALGDRDAFPESDLGLLRAMAMTARELSARAERWRPYRGYAAMYLWLGLV